MKKTTVRTGIFVLACALIVIVYLIFQYNKPHVDVYTANADYVISIDQLLRDFKEDETAATEKYVDKIIITEGIVQSVEISDGNALLQLVGDIPGHRVICYMNDYENIKIPELKPGSPLSIKGICTGYLMDVILTKAIVIP